MTEYSSVSDRPFHTFRQQRIYPVVLLVIAMLCLSLNHVIGRGVYADVPPIGLGFWRWLIGGLLILPLVWSNRKRSFPIIRANLKGLMLLGVLLAVSSTSVLLALHYTTATNAALINATQPTITAYLAWLVFKDRFQWIQKLGVFLAFVGVVVMLAKGDVGMLLDMDFNLGDFIVVCAMFGLAAYSIKLRIVPEELTSIETLFAILMVGSAVLLPFYILESIVYKPVPISSTAIFSILTMALVVVVIGMLTWNIGIQLLGPAIAAVFLNLIPIFGAILAIMFLGEQYYLYHFLCLLLVCAGMLLVLGQKLIMRTENEKEGMLSTK